LVRVLGVELGVERDASTPGVAAVTTPGQPNKKRHAHLPNVFTRPLLSRRGGHPKHCAVVAEVHPPI
jgi:hypothetical protein